MASRFELRPMRYIIGAYFLAPIAGINSLWLFLLLLILFTQPSAASSFQAIWVFVNVIGLILGLVIELVVVTPLLIGFHHWRWRWLNGWTGAALGFLTLAIPAAPLFQPLQPHVVADHVSTVVHFSRSAGGWLADLAASSAAGAVGAVAALAFRLIAVRMAPAATSVE
jgi:hypothetical protein